MTKEEIFKHLVYCRGFEVTSKGESGSSTESYKWQMAFAQEPFFGAVYENDTCLLYYDGDTFIKVTAENKVFGCKIENPTPDCKQGRVQIIVSFEDGEQAFIYEIAPTEIYYVVNLIKRAPDHSFYRLIEDENNGLGIDKRISNSEMLNGATVSVVNKLRVVDLINQSMEKGQARVRRPVTTAGSSE